MSKESGGLDLAVAQALIAKESEGILVEIHGPDFRPLPAYKGKPVSVTVYGSYSPEYQKLNDEFERTYMAERLEGLKAGSTEWSKAFQQAQREQEHERDKRVRAHAVKEWHGFLDGGKELEPDPDTVWRFMQLPWFNPQIRLGQDRHEGFSGTASDD